MKKGFVLGSWLLLLAFQFCFGSQSETMQVRSFINPDSTAATLEYRVTLLQDTFLLYDPVGIHLWVKNLSSDTAQVWFDQTQGWVLKDQDGKQYVSTVSILYAGPRFIPPVDSFGGLTGLDSDYGIKIPGPYPYPSLPVGKYEVYYKIGRDSTALLTFRVVEPKGSEGEALKYFLDAYSPIIGSKFSQSTSEQRTAFFREHVEKLLHFVDRYPKSVYAIDALPQALSAAWGILHDHGFAYQINNKIMRDYPNSRLNGFDFLKAYYADNSAALRAVLDSIIKVNPHPRITAGAKATLRELGLEKQ